MPLIQIRYKTFTSRGGVISTNALRLSLPVVAAKALTCVEGGPLAAKDIMIEFDGMSDEDVNCKDIHVRVWAHDYAARLEDLDRIRKEIAREVVSHLDAGTSWYVWVLLASTSYGSDTEA